MTEPELGSGALHKRLCERITSYLTLGGLFNAELMNHDAVRELLIDCRVGLSLSSPIEPEQASGTHVCPVCQNHQPHDHSELVEKGLPMALAIGSFSSLHSVAAILGKMREDYEKAAAGPQASSEIRERLAAIPGDVDTLLSRMIYGETVEDIRRKVAGYLERALAPSRQGAGGK